MLSSAPRAISFRDFAESVLFKVMTTGSYNSPVLTQILTQLNEAVLLQSKMLQNLATEVHSVKSQQAIFAETQALIQERQKLILVPANRDIRNDPTPSQRIRQLLLPEKPPKYFNKGGRFDNDAAEEYAREFGGSLALRDRRHINKRPEYVIQICPEHDAFLRRFYRKFLSIWSQKQVCLDFEAAKLKKQKR